jgi:periplasmic copper chaperone A
MPVKKGAALAALLLASCSVQSAPPDIAVDDAWARATAPGQTTAAIYFTVSNNGGEDRLIGVSTPAGQASVHSTSMDGGVMRMRPIPALGVPAGSTVELKPRGLHVMVAGLEKPLEAGSTVPLRLVFDESGERWVVVTVRPASANGALM